MITPSLPAVCGLKHGVSGGSLYPSTSGSFLVSAEELWIEWKTNGRFPTRSTVPWKSRKGGEIPTFPQLRRLLSHAQKTGEQKTEGCGRVEIQNQDSHFSTAPKACGARKVPGQHPFAPDATHTKQRGGQLCFKFL